MDCIKESVENLLKVEGVKAKGFGIIPKIAMQDDRLTIEAKAIYAYFCSFAGAGTTAFPSIKKIIKDLKISVKRYYKHFELLKQFGYVKTTQIKSDGKFDRNIYTLVENPKEIEVEDKKENENQKKDVVNERKKSIDSPISQNDQTVDLPISRFAHTQNDQTKNNNIKNNNYIYNNHSINHNTTDKKNEVTEGKIDMKNNELEKIYKQSEINLLNEKEKEYTKKTIADLFFCKGLKIKDNFLDREEIRRKLYRLNLNTLDYAIKKFKESRNFTKVNNPEKYFRVVLLNAVDEAELERIRTG